MSAIAFRSAVAALWMAWPLHWFRLIPMNGHTKFKAVPCDAYGRFKTEPVPHHTKGKEP